MCGHRQTTDKQTHRVGTTKIHRQSVFCLCCSLRWLQLCTSGLVGDHPSIPSDCPSLQSTRTPARVCMCPNLSLCVGMMRDAKVSTWTLNQMVQTSKDGVMHDMYVGVRSDNT